MARCEACEYPLSDDRERLGARCPSCHAPVYEPATRFSRKARPDEPQCAAHPGLESVGPCARCTKHVCETCRTRWRGAVLCVACVRQAMDSVEATPAMAQAARSQAFAGATFAAVGWLMAAAGYGLMSAAHSSGGDAAPILTLAAVITAAAGALPAAVGAGMAAAALRGQTERPDWAWTGFVAGGAYAGLVLAVGMMGLWQ